MDTPTFNDNMGQKGQAQSFEWNYRSIEVQYLFNRFSFHKKRIQGHHLEQ